MIELSFEDKKDQWKEGNHGGAGCKVEGAFQWYRKLEIERSMQKHDPLRKPKQARAKLHVMDTETEKSDTLTYFW